MNNSIKFLSLLLLFAVFFFGCNSGKKSNGIDSNQRVYPETPDSSSYLKVANFLEEDEMENIINEETTLKNGKSRKKGIMPIPQDGDDFRNANLDDIYWHNVSVIEGDFRGASMRSSKCEDSNFDFSNFRVSDIRWSWFDRSRFFNCRFSQAKLFHVHVNNAIMEGSDFRGANMFGMEGHQANMRHCDLTNALLKDAEFTFADFTHTLAAHARLIRAVMSHSKFDSTNFSLCDFTGGRLEGTSFINANLEGSNFQGSHLQSADFTGANLKNCTFYGAQLKNTKFNDALNIPEHIKVLLVDDEVTATVPTQVK